MTVLGTLQLCEMSKCARRVDQDMLQMRVDISYRWDVCLFSAHRSMHR